MTLSLLEKGFDYVDYLNGGYENADSLAALVATGANSIETSIEYGINPQTDMVYADPVFTDNLAAYGATIARAVSMGLSVTVRPLIDFVNPAYLAGTSYSFAEWRSYFNPGPAGSAGANNFFASYANMLMQYAQVGVANGATTLCIGTEIDQITGPAYKFYWDAIISALHTQFPTLKLTYSADWNDSISPWAFHGTGLPLGTGNLATQVSFASELDSLGIDAYAPLSTAANPTLAQLIAGWTQEPTVLSTFAVTHGASLINYFESVAAAVGKPLIFSEIGYENATDAASSPAGSSTHVVDSALQAELYQAFFQAWQQAGNSSLTGVYFWNWDPNSADVGPGKPANFSPQGLPAQGVVTSWFGPSTVTAQTDNGAHSVGPGHLVTITLNTVAAEIVTGAPTLQLNDNEAATYAGGSGTNALTFYYVAQSGDSSSDLHVTGLNLPSGATIHDANGNALSTAVTADLGIAINTASIPPATTVQQEVLGLYTALYNRAADSPGLIYWEGVVGSQADSGGVTPATAATTAVTAQDAQLLGQLFVASQSTYFNATYGGLTDSQFISAIYTHIGGNSGDPTGVQYWSGVLGTLEAQGVSAQTARSEIIGQFVQAIIADNLTTQPAGLSTADWQAAIQRQTSFDDKMAGSLMYSMLSNQPGGAILDPQSVNDAAYQAATRAIQNVTYDPQTETTAIAHIQQAVANNNLALI
jgi:Domain of unknown function (DUF4214)